MDFTYNTQNAEDFNKTFQQNFAMNIPTIKSLFEFILRKTDLSNPPNQELL
jgi:hypothetical protein